MRIGTGKHASVQKQPATCTSQGRSTYTCTVCGYSYTEEDSGLPTGHSFTSRIKKEPTCTEDGIRENVCDLCGEVTETKINAHGHNYEITDVQSTDGNTRRTYTCSICGDSYTQELGNQYEEVSNYVEYLFEQYRPYMIWVFLATAGVWSIAIGVAIDHIENIHKYAREEDRPEKTLFVITTDGMENASKKYTRKDVRAMIEERKSAGWQFVFVAANIDAVSTGASIGIREDCCKQYDVGDERAMYCCMSMMVSDYRSAGSLNKTRRRPNFPKDDANKK